MNICHHAKLTGSINCHQTQRLHSDPLWVCQPHFLQALTHSHSFITSSSQHSVRFRNSTRIGCCCCLLFKLLMLFFSCHVGPLILSERMAGKGSSTTDHFLFSFPCIWTLNHLISQKRGVWVKGFFFFKFLKILLQYCIIIFIIISYYFTLLWCKEVIIQRGISQSDYCLYTKEDVDKIDDRPSLGRFSQIWL